MEGFKKNKRGTKGVRNDRGGYKPMCDVICSSCGRSCKVPFKPINGKPVYCSGCFGRIKNSRIPTSEQNKNEFDVLNSKLDRILSLLESQERIPESKKVDKSDADSNL